MFVGTTVVPITYILSTNVVPGNVRLWDYFRMIPGKVVNNQHSSTIHSRRTNMYDNYTSPRRRAHIFVVLMKRLIFSFR